MSHQINISKVNAIPSHIGDEDGFGLCFYGNPDEELQEWLHHWKLSTSPSGQFTNINLNNENLYSMFNLPVSYEYVDGFSPNTNKHLHIGHFSQMVIAKALQKLVAGKKFVAIIGDTLEGEINHDDALKAFYDLCNKFNYNIDKVFFASKMSYDNSKLINGEGKYENTKVFDINGQKQVGIKSGGETTYFYQDVALATELNAPTLYITASEQKEHFQLLTEMFPQNKHYPIGLVTVKGLKMGTRLGNEVLIDEFFNELLKYDITNEKLAYNIFAGHVLKSHPKTNKELNMDTLKDFNSSLGLYLSYTAARFNKAFKKAGISDISQTFHPISKSLQYAHIKSIWSLQPNILLNATLELCKKMNGLYNQKLIVGNKKNQDFFMPMLIDLLTAMDFLGMYVVDEV